MWAATSGFALAAGPVVGGVLTGVWSWRGIFWFNLVFGLAALIVAAVILPESADPTAARVDIAGTFLGAGALATFVFAIIDAESAGFGAADVIVLLCVSAALVAAFAWQEYRAPNPLLDLRYLRVPQFTHGEHHRVLHLLRHVRHLLLHRAVPGRGRGRVRLPAGAGVPADDRADDHLVGTGRTVDGPGRAALVY